MDQFHDRRPIAAEYNLAPSTRTNGTVVPLQATSKGSLRVESTTSPGGAGVPTSETNKTVPVTASAAIIAPADATRSVLLVTWQGGSAFYVGPSTVTPGDVSSATGGTLVPGSAGGFYRVEGSLAANALYGITSSGSAVAGIKEGKA